MLERNIKYKQVTRIQVYGDDDINSSTNSQYSLPNYITSIAVSSGGSGYGTEPPELIFVGGSGSGLTATANLSGGSITSITITNKGSPYTVNPTIRQKHSVVGTFSKTVTITNGGAGYPASAFLDLKFTGGGGFDAAATAVTNGSGVIINVIFTNLGYNYSSVPSVSIVLPPFASNPTTAATLTFTIQGTLASLNVSSGIVTNGKRMRFDLKGQLGDVILSRNARAILEMACIPSFSNASGQTAVLRIITPTQDKVFDTKKFLNGNPILFSMPLSSTANTLNTLYNATEFFYNINVPSNFLSNGYIDCELEIPAQTTSAVDFITNNPLKNLYINLVIVDEDLEITNDTILAPPINMKNDNTNMPIRPY